MLECTINDWLADAAWQPRFSWAAGKPPAVGMSVSGPVGAAVLIAALRLTTTRALTACSGCGRLFEPTRSPRSGESSWFPDCGTRAARREASRRWRAPRHSNREAPSEADAAHHRRGAEAALNQLLVALPFRQPNRQPTAQTSPDDSVRQWTESSAVPADADAEGRRRTGGCLTADAVWVSSPSGVHISPPPL